MAMAMMTMMMTAAFAAPAASATSAAFAASLREHEHTRHMTDAGRRTTDDG